MTKEELKEHCKRQVECCEMWARNNGGEPHGKVYEEHKLVLDLINALEQSGEDCVSRQAVFETLDDCNSDGLKGIFCSYDDGERFKEYIKNLPPITPTRCIAAVRFSKEDLREICNERIEIECTHGTCKDCKKY